MDLWLFESLGYESVFWTNFRVGAVLFIVGAIVFGTAAALPAFAYGLSATAKRRALQLGAVVAVLAGYLMSWHYLTYLAAMNARSFGETDPVFGHDIGFYVFELPAIITTLHALDHPRGRSAAVRSRVGDLQRPRAADAGRHAPVDRDAGRRCDTPRALDAHRAWYRRGCPHIDRPLRHPHQGQLRRVGVPRRGVHRRDRLLLDGQRVTRCRRSRSCSVPSRSRCAFAH